MTTTVATQMTMTLSVERHRVTITLANGVPVLILSFEPHVSPRQRHAVLAYGAHSAMHTRCGYRGLSPAEALELMARFGPEFVAAARACLVERGWAVSVESTEEVQP